MRILDVWPGCLRVAGAVAIVGIGLVSCNGDGGPAAPAPDLLSNTSNLCSPLSIDVTCVGGELGAGFGNNAEVGKIQIRGVTCPGAEVSAKVGGFTKTVTARADGKFYIATSFGNQTWTVGEEGSVLARLNGEQTASIEFKTKIGLCDDAKLETPEESPWWKFWD